MPCAAFSRSKQFSGFICRSEYLDRICKCRTWQCELGVDILYTVSVCKWCTSRLYVYKTCWYQWASWHIALLRFGQPDFLQGPVEVHCWDLASLTFCRAQLRLWRRGAYAIYSWPWRIGKEGASMWPESSMWSHLGLMLTSWLAYCNASFRPPQVWQSFLASLKLARKLLYKALCYMKYPSSWRQLMVWAAALSMWKPRASRHVLSGSTHLLQQNVLLYMPLLSADVVTIQRLTLTQVFNTRISFLPHDLIMQVHMHPYRQHSKSQSDHCHSCLDCCSFRTLFWKTATDLLPLSTTIVLHVQRASAITRCLQWADHMHNCTLLAQCKGEVNWWRQQCQQGKQQ